MNNHLRRGDTPLNEWLARGDIHLDYTFRTRKECQYVTDLVGETWRYWDPGSPVFISAPTGTGKNTFIEDVILKEVLTHNRRYADNELVAVVQNRTPLIRQTLERDAKVVTRYTGDAQAQESLNDFTESGINKYIRQIGPIFILTYQFLATPEGMHLLQTKRFDYIILDEAHFFTSDALFNADTEKILQSIVRFCNGGIRIYLSATIETAFEPIARAEFYEWKRRRQPTQTAHDAIAPFTAPTAWSFERCFASLQRSCEKLHFKFYDFERKYEHLNMLNPICSEALPDEIEKRRGRWIVFVANKQDGQTMRKELEDKGISAVFLSSESKDSVAFHELIKAETIEAAEVIIATAVIDNGVNIRDERVTDIAIMIFDRTEFLQMFGRLRVNPHASQSVRLWLPEWNDEELKKRLLADVRKLVDFLCLEGMSREAQNALIENYLQYKTGVRINVDKGLYYSRCVIYSLVESIERITGILRNRNPEFTIGLDNDNPYYARALQIYYAAAQGKLPMADAVSRALLGLKLLDDTEFMESQIAWNRTSAADDSFLYHVYSMRIKDLQKTLQSRVLQNENPAPDSCADRHPSLSNENLKKALRRQMKLQERFGKSPSAWEEVHFWLELDPPKEKQALKNSGTVELSAELLMNFSIPAETLHAACPKEKICQDKNLLAQYGIKKDDFESLETSKAKPVQAFIALKSYYGTMVNNADITATQLMNKSKNAPVRLDDFDYHVASVLSPSHDTFYLILRTPIAPC